MVCLQRPPEHGYVCEEDREFIARQLHGLIGQVQRLSIEVTPGARRGDGIRVSTSKGTPPLPARLDALSLIGPGAERVTAMLHPKVRHWRTTREVDVSSVKRTVLQHRENGPFVPHAEVVTERRVITEWHQELARDESGQLLLVADDNQIGTLPPREWLGAWVRTLQETFRGQPARRRRDVPWLLRYQADAQANIRTPKPDRRSTAAVVAAILTADPTTAPVIAAIKAVKDQYDQALLDTISGRSYGYGGDVSLWTRSDDPLADDVIARFGAVLQPQAAVPAGVAYLLLWLDEICDHPDVPVADFAGELRSLSAELSRVLGDQPAQVWLGRCPARITDPETEVTAPCGAGIWQDPHASQVQCPRCHSTWGPKRVELLQLATDMRRTWPVDRRRLYTEVETRQVRRPRCPACGGLADIIWRDVTGVGEKTRVFQASGAKCPAGCDEAKQAI